MMHACGVAARRPAPLLTAASHTVLVLLEHGHSVTMIDNMSNSFSKVFSHMKKLAGNKASSMSFVEVSSCCEKLLWNLL